MPAPGASLRVPIERRNGAEPQAAYDAVAVEEPLEIRIEDTPIAVVMRTPGDDDDLVRGFLLTEGILLAPDELRAIEPAQPSRVSVRLRAGVAVDPEQFRRNLFTYSSCGICGKASIEAVQLVAPRARPAPVSRAVLDGLTAALRRSQPTFDETGGLHAAGVFTTGGEPLAVREDVGRHNAVDKAIGAVAARQWPLPPSLLVVSGRQSFEIVQKAAMARISGVVGVSAPSSLAVELAGELGMLLVGFARDGRFNVYAGAEAIDG